MQFILTTDPTAADLSSQLQYIYSTFFVSHVLKNPLYTPGQPFACVDGGGLVVLGCRYGVQTEKRLGQTWAQVDLSLSVQCP